jgi:hypothetical protein
MFFSLSLSLSLFLSLFLSFDLSLCVGGSSKEREKRKPTLKLRGKEGR